jgi:NAD(P)-dependent dehydrogenase (short-subunit alcohol dehydrogenase family)
VIAFGEQVRADGFHCTRLVNNAGMQGQTLISELDGKTWDRVLRVNLSGTAWMTREFTPGMIDRGFGRILNFASMYAYHPGIGQAPYAAAKAGIIGLTHATALDLARHGITANVLAPGLIFHEGLRALMGPLDLGSMAEKIPMGRAGRPEEIASTVDFLLSEECSYITGQTIHVNGGLYLPG